MRFRVEKIIYSDGTTKFYPQYRRWFPFGCYWDYIRKEKPFTRTVFDTEEDAWKYIKSLQEYPKVSYTYKENT